MLAFMLEILKYDLFNGNLWTEYEETIEDLRELEGEQEPNDTQKAGDNTKEE